MARKGGSGDPGRGATGPFSPPKGLNLYHYTYQCMARNDSFLHLPPHPHTTGLDPPLRLRYRNGQPAQAVSCLTSQGREASIGSKMNLCSNCSQSCCQYRLGCTIFTFCLIAMLFRKPVLPVPPESLASIPSTLVMQSYKYLAREGTSFVVVS